MSSNSRIHEDLPDVVRFCDRLAAVPRDVTVPVRLTAPLLPLMEAEVDVAPVADMPMRPIPVLLDSNVDDVGVCDPVELSDDVGDVESDVADEILSVLLAASELLEVAVESEGVELEMTVVVAVDAKDETLEAETASVVVDSPVVLPSVFTAATTVTSKVGSEDTPVPCRRWSP